MSPRRVDVAVLTLAAAAVVGSIALLAARLPLLPDVVPGWRGTTVAKSALQVLRVPAIGGALLVVVAVYLRRAAATGGARGLFRAAALALAVKTPAEAIELALTGVDAPAARAAARAATIAAVAGFVVYAFVALRRGALRTERAGGRWRDLAPIERALVVAALVAWAALATAPGWAA